MVQYGVTLWDTDLLQADALVHAGETPGCPDEVTLEQGQEAQQRQQPPAHHASGYRITNTAPTERRPAGCQTRRGGVTWRRGGGRARGGAAARRVSGGPRGPH